ncbi:hypothetical protein Tco_0294887 [Tanacetum coccineum]
MDESCLCHSSMSTGPKSIYPVDTSLIRKESRKSPTTVLFDVDTGRISIRHCKILKSTTINVLARSDDNA